MTTPVLFDNPRFFTELYDKQIRLHEPELRSFCVASHRTGITLERRGMTTVWWLYCRMWGSTFDTEATFREILSKVSHITNPAEVLAAAKVCISMKKLLPKSKAMPIQRLGHDFRTQSLSLIRQLAKQEHSSPFLTACRQGLFSQAIYFLEQDRELLINAREYFSPLLLTAYKKKKFEFCLRMIHLGAALDGLTPDDIALLLKEALENERTSSTIAATLIQAKPNFEKAVGTNGEQVLHIACRKRLFDTVKLMCAKGAPLTGVDARGNTPLHVACEVLHAEMALFFCQQGASCAHTNTEGVPPLKMALKCARQEAVKQFYIELFPMARSEIHQYGPHNFIPHTESLEIAHFMNDEALAKKIAQISTQTEFLKRLATLKSKYPLSDLSLIEFSPLDLNAGHLELKEAVLGRYIQPVEQPMDLEKELGKLYKNQAKLKKFLTHVRNRQELFAVPKEVALREEFYSDIENCLKMIISYFTAHPEERALLASFLLEFEEALSSERGDRYYYTFTSEFHRICKKSPATFKDEILKTLEDYRRFLVQKCLDPKKETMISQHNFVMRNCGKKIGLQEAATSYINSYSWVDQLQWEIKFFKLYTPQNIQRECIEPKLATDTAFKERFIAWQGHEDTSPQAVTNMLLQFGILSSTFTTNWSFT